MDANSIITLVIALGGWILALVVAWFNYKQKSNEIYFDALQFLTGYTQKRNVGITVVEGYWHQKRYRHLSIPLISNQAIYLLLGSKAENYVMEVNNLYRMMNLLLSVKKISKKYLFNYESLFIAVFEAKESENREKGLRLPKETLIEWINKLSALLGKTETQKLISSPSSTRFFVNEASEEK